MKKLLGVGAILIVLIIIASILSSNPMGGSISVQHYNAQNEPVGSPILPGPNWADTEGEPLSVALVTISWAVFLAGVDPDTVLVKGKLSVWFSYSVNPTIIEFSSDKATDEKVFSFVLGKLLLPDQDGSIKFEGILNAHGLDDSGSQVDVPPWTDSIIVSYTWNNGAIVIQDSNGG